MDTAQKIVTLMRAGLPEDAVGVILGVDRDTVVQATTHPSDAPPVAVAVGPKGDKGDKGDKGVKGDRGDAGAPGVVPPGDKGATGDTGPTGDKGATGDKGPTGDRGPQGLPGLQGANGQPGVKGATGDKGPTGDAGSGGGAVGFKFDVDVAGVGFVDIPGLAGDTDIEYEVVLDGRVVTGGVARNINLRPNEIVANTYNTYTAHTRDAGAVGGPTQGPYDGSGLFLGYTWAGDSDIALRGSFFAKSGRARKWLGDLLSTTAAPQEATVHTVGRWNDTATVVASARIDFGGGTYTGRVRVAAR